MANVLIINGHQKADFSAGKLNQTLMNEMKKVISENPEHKIKTTIIQKGYKVAEEQKKFLWADTIIYQFPIYWFGTPALLKQYMQDVYAYGLFYQTSENGYGMGGMLNGRTYMLSTTWNAPLDSFGYGFWRGIYAPDAALIEMHQAQTFIGLRPLPSFSCHDVVKHPQVDVYLQALKRHLELIFLK